VYVLLGLFSLSNPNCCGKSPISVLGGFCNVVNDVEPLDIVYCV
jgi:hypothetical protein